jgi:hypothetical protein
MRHDNIAAALEVPHIYVDILKGPRAPEVVRRHWHSNGDEARTWELALNPRTGPLTHANLITKKGPEMKVCLRGLAMF